MKAERKSKFTIQLLFFLYAIVGCGGGGCGSGCNGLSPTVPFDEKDKIEIAGQVRVTKSGLEFLEENLEPIIAAALPEGGLDFCVPGDGGDIIGLVRWGYCQRDICEDGQTGCQLNLGIESVDVTLEQPSTVAATVRFDELSIEIPLVANPIVDCSIRVNGDGFELTLPVYLDTPEPSRYLSVELGGVPEYELSELDIRLRSEGGGLSFLCTAIDGVINLPFIGDLILGALQDLIDGLLFDQLSLVFDGLSCKPCQEVSDCQDYAAQTCDQGICRQSDGNCVVAPLGIEGQLDLGQILGGLLSTPAAPVDILAVPGSFVNVEQDGLSLGLIGGFRSPRNRCVPPVPPSELTDLDPSNLLRGGMLGEEEDFQLGFGVTRSAVNRLMWSLYNTGGLCVQVAGDTISQLNTSLLGVIFPDLANLARNPRAPVAITISPQRPPEVAFGTNVVELDENGVPNVIDPLLSISVEELWLDFHVFMDHRWVRFASLHTNVDLPFAVDFTGDNKLVPLLGDLSQALHDLRVENAELLRGNTDLVVTILPMLINVFAGGLLTDLVEPIALPAFLGFELDLEGTTFTGIEDGEMLAVFTGLRSESQMVISEVDTAVEVIRTSMPDYRQLPALGLEAWKSIGVEVVADVADSSVEPVATEVSYRVDGSTWSPFQPSGQITIRSPQFLVQGRHLIEVRGRRTGDYRSMDTTPTSVEIILDNVDPNVELTAEKEVVEITAYDFVTPTELLMIDVIGPSGQVQVDDRLRFSAEAPGMYRVRVVDEAGNIGQAEFQSEAYALVGRPAPGSRESSGCGCHQDSSPPMRSLLAVFGVLMFLSTRRLSLWAIMVLCTGFLFGCEDEGGARKDIDTPDMGRISACIDHDECVAESQYCVEGFCQTLECDSHPDCDALSCENGSALCAPDGVCVCGQNCGGNCGDHEVCCEPSQTCLSAFEGCPSSCPEGYERQSNPLLPDPFVCAVPDQNCECQPLPEIQGSFIGRYASLATDGQTVFVSAYDEGFGDLVVGEVAANLSVDWMWVDGVPEGAPIVGSPLGPRGGVTELGSDVGRFTDLAVDQMGRLHVVYYGEQPGTLYYALGVENTPNEYTWSTVRLDEAGDAGRWASISLDEQGRPGVGYQVAYLNGVSQLRYLFASVETPTARADWTTPFLIQARSIDVPLDRLLETYPEGTGLYISQVRDSDGFPVLAWYDRSEGKLWMSRFSEAGFLEPTLVAGWGHLNPELNGDMGANVDIALDGDGNIHYCFQDGSTDSLRYLAPELGRSDWVDDGVWVDTGGRRQALHVVGEDCHVLFDPQGNPLIIYQDSTQQALLLRRRNRQTSGIDLEWSGRIGLRADVTSTSRAYGFYASAVVINSTVWIGHLVYDRQDEYEGYYEVFTYELSP